MTIRMDWKLFEDRLRVSSAEKPPTALWCEVAKDLTPSWKRVLMKALGAHFFASLLTLGVCPQFGLGYFGAHGPLSHLFHSLGEIGCQLACGAFYFGTFGLLWTVLLRRSERRFVGYQKGLVFTGGLIALTLGGFWMVSPQGVTQAPFWAWLVGAYLSVAPTWLLGVTLGQGAKPLTTLS